MNTNIKADVIKDKSFDPNFELKVSYNDGTNVFINEIVSVDRKPPRVTIEYPENIKKLIDKIDVKKMELAILEAIVEFLLGPTR